MRKISAMAILILIATLASPWAAAQKKSVDAEGHQWWQHAVFYEIYPRSFADSNNDGIGDLKGITSKMDYLHDLGIDAIWITPCFPSPQVDFGYDVSDYENIDPMYGTLADFDRMAAEGKKHDIAHHSRLRRQPHLRPAQVVPRLEVLEDESAIATGTSGTTASTATSRPTTGSPTSAARPGSSIRRPISTTTTTSMPSSPT